MWKPLPLMTYESSCCTWLKLGIMPAGDSYCQYKGATKLVAC